MLTIYIDLDDTIFDFKTPFIKSQAEHPEIAFPHSQPGFFLNLEPLEGAVEAVKTLKAQGHRVLFLTAPSVHNPLCYTEKRLSIEKHFGFDACYGLIIAHDKSLLRGDVLIDDRENSNNQNLFKGHFIKFDLINMNWELILEYVQILNSIESVGED